MSSVPRALVKDCVAVLLAVTLGHHRRRLHARHAPPIGRRFMHARGHEEVADVWRAGVAWRRCRAGAA